MSDRVNEFLDRFPFLVGMEEGVFIVGGSARYLIGACNDYPKDLDIRCPCFRSFRKIARLLGAACGNSSSMDTSLKREYEGFLVDLWHYQDSPDIGTYIPNVPLSRDGIAVRFSSDREMSAIISPDFWGPVVQRNGPKVIKTQSFNEHIAKGLLHD